MINYNNPKSIFPDVYCQVFTLDNQPRAKLYTTLRKKNGGGEWFLMKIRKDNYGELTPEFISIFYEEVYRCLILAEYVKHEEHDNFIMYELDDDQTSEQERLLNQLSLKFK